MGSSLETARSRVTATSSTPAKKTMPATGKTTVQVKKIRRVTAPIRTLQAVIHQSRTRGQIPPMMASPLRIRPPEAARVR